MIIGSSLLGAALVCTGYLLVTAPGLSVHVAFVTEPGPSERVSFIPTASAYPWHVSPQAATFITLINLESASLPATLRYFGPSAEQLAEQSLVVAPGMTVVDASSVVPECRHQDE